MSYLYEKTYPECPETCNNLIIPDFQVELSKKFRESCPERWEEVVKMQKKFSSRYRSLTCVTFFSKEKGKASGETIHQEDFDFTGKEISISNNTASSFDYDLDLIYNNIFVVVTLWVNS